MTTWRPALRRAVKLLLLTGAGVALLLSASAAYLFWPRSPYPRPYLQGASVAAAPPLASLAEQVQLHIGAAVHDTEVEAFTAAAGRDFNSMTPANALKWGNLLEGGKLGKYDFRAADELVDLGLAKQTRVRGHALVWGRFAGQGYPADLEQVLKAAADPKRALEQISSEHIATVLRHFHGRIAQWDIVNEPLDLRKPEWDDSVFYRTLGPEFVAQSFRLAHAADPSLELVLNEQLQSYDDEHAQLFFDVVRQLRDSGVPIHGVGLQSHVMMEVPSVATIESYLRRFTELGLFVEITELDARLRLFSDSPDPYAAQGRFFQEITAACLRVPRCRGITVWGISDRFSWFDSFPPFQWMKPNEPLLFDHDGRRKPAYTGVVEALQQAPAERRRPPP